MKSFKAVFSPSQDLFISYVYTLFLGVDLWCPNPKSVSSTWLSPAWASPHIQFLFSQPRDLLKVLLSFSTVSARIARCCYGRISPKSGFIVLVYLFLLIDQQQRVDRLGFLNLGKGKATGSMKLSRFMRRKRGHWKRSMPLSRTGPPRTAGARMVSSSWHCQQHTNWKAGFPCALPLSLWEASHYPLQASSRWLPESSPWKLIPYSGQWDLFQASLLPWTLVIGVKPSQKSTELGMSSKHAVRVFYFPSTSAENIFHYLKIEGKNNFYLLKRELMA